MSYTFILYMYIENILSDVEAMITT